METSGTPAVLGRFRHPNPRARIVIYNHLDVQPAGGSEWRQADPFAFEVGKRNAALLVELRRADAATLASAVDDVHAILKRHRLVEPVRFTTGEAERAALWHLRKGLAARTGAMRPSGTAFLTEDVAVPVARLAEAIRDCQELFARHGIPDTAIFGHAKDGNLHFVLAEDVRSPEAVERYGDFMHGLVELVVGQYDGTVTDWPVWL